jgi:hypothetical protein
VEPHVRLLELGFHGRGLAHQGGVGGVPVVHFTIQRIDRRSKFVN